MRQVLKHFRRTVTYIYIFFSIHTVICGNLRFAGVDLLDVRDTEPATVRNLRKMCVLFCFVLLASEFTSVTDNLTTHRS